VGADDEPERRLMERWAEVAETNLIELTERLKAGADIVLATCSIAGTLTDEVRDPTDVFDWVIIEEAAKAWPTEIVMPLVLGVRWTLVGDHRQLGPHRAREVEIFLDSLKGHRDERIKLHYASRDSYLDHVQMFGGFFKDRLTNDRASAASPVDALDTQFRMHPSIAQPFARAFYPAVVAQTHEQHSDAGVTGTTRAARLAETFLKSDEEIDQYHSVSKPVYLSNAPLVWLDTTDLGGCEDEGYWWNPGEIDLVEGLVREMGFDSRTPAEDLVILTPYRKQIQKMRARGFPADRVHTVHSFQGREAKVVIASLVRSKERGPHVRHNLGHTAQPEVVNVMLSRAQQLLLVVGSLEQFEVRGGPDWKNVVTAFRDYGRIVDAETGEVR
jgi:superfamily I DNA and/or RNA helicase